MKLDILIKNACIVDGTGAQPFKGHVGLKDGKIALVQKGNVAEGKEAALVVDADGKYLSPGFIDIHRHGDVAVFRENFGKLELQQGLTTIVNGNCGLSLVPLSPNFEAEVKNYLFPVTGKIHEFIKTASVAEYHAQLSAHYGGHLPINVGMLAGSGTIRASRFGYEKQKLSAREKGDVRSVIERSLSHGALGVSLGLGYAPECFYSTEDLIDVLAPLKGTNSVVAVHMRDEAYHLEESVAEMIEVAERLKIHVHVSHLKAIGKDNWNSRVEKSLNLLKAARERGENLTCDVYPYTAGSTQLIHVLPHDFLVGGNAGIARRLQIPAERENLTYRILHTEAEGSLARAVGWENISLAALTHEENKQFLGKTIVEAAEMAKKGPFDFTYDLLISENCRVTMIDKITCDEDLERIIRGEFSNFISDSTYPTQGMFHPRVANAFVRTLEQYVKTGKFPLEKIIQKQTSMCAQVVNLHSKGKIAPGFDGDLVIFQLEKIHENATFSQPLLPPSGIEKVFVGGVLALDNGEVTGNCGGKILTA